MRKCRWGRRQSPEPGKSPGPNHQTKRGQLCQPEADPQCPEGHLWLPQSLANKWPCVLRQGGVGENNLPLLFLQCDSKNPLSTSVPSVPFLSERPLLMFFSGEIYHFTLQMPTLPGSLLGGLSVRGNLCQPAPPSYLTTL
jgi:hypothetical protein